ncbi:methionine--tRNA ligase [Elusimicrobiota bacterium]
MKYYITTPIYYVNDFPHIGHAYTTIAADVVSRWQRLHGKEVFFLTGTDEHGAKIAQAAKKQNESPKEFCDKIAKGFKATWKELDISNDGFIRTTDTKHKKAVQYFLDKLFTSKNIYKAKYNGLYCIQCEKFTTEDELDENGCCVDHKQKPVHHSEENYFFKLSAFKDKLLEILSDEKHPQHMAVFPLTRRNEIIGKLKTGLEDISISRAALEWGIPLPFDKNQTAYVWIDALLNYVSAIGYSTDEKQFKQTWPAQLHLMAKDILWFHSVIWPAMLLALGIETPKKVFAHGFFTINGEKMSKTLGNVIRPSQMIEKFGKDATRYLTLSLFPFGVDGNISWNALTDKYNVDLANNLGNLVARTTTMIDKYFEGTIPERKGKSEFSVFNEIKSIDALFEDLSFTQCITKIQKCIDSANRYIDSTAPWKMAKENNPDLSNVMFDLLQSIGIIAIYLIPFMPTVSQNIWHQIGEKTKVEDFALEFFKKAKTPDFPHPGRNIAKGEILFPRITDK